MPPTARSQTGKTGFLQPLKMAKVANRMLRVVPRCKNLCTSWCLVIVCDYHV